MKKGFGLLELIFVIVIAVVLFMMFGHKSGRDNPFEEVKKVNTQKEMAEQKIKEIEDIQKSVRKIDRIREEDF